MAGEFTLDTSKLETALLRSEKETERGIGRGLTAIKNDWVADSVDIAPIGPLKYGGGNLRKQISGQVDDVSVIVKGNATHGDDAFNYGYWVHEVHGNKFLDDAFDEDKAQETLEREVEKALRKAGF